MPVACFLAEMAGMCAVMCIGGSVLSLASFAIAKALGYSNLAQQALELSAAIVTVCLALPMATYMAVRGHGRRRNVVMTGSTAGVGIVVIALLWSGAISASGPQTWQSLFGLICPRPAWSWSWRRCSASTSAAAEHAITALRLDQRRHLRLAQPDSRSAPGYLDRRSILAIGRRVQDRRSRSHATPVGRPGRGGREWDNKSPRKTASHSTPVAYR
jgi:MFS family permease